MGVILAGGLSSHAFAGTISYTCGSGISASTCASTVNGTIAGLYGATFSNASADIYIYMGTAGLGASLQYYDNTSYHNYATHLAAHEEDTNDITAVNSLGGNSTDPVVPGDGVALTSALAAALGISGGVGIFDDGSGACDPFAYGCTAEGSSCILSTANCYNGIISISSSLPLYYRDGTQTDSQFDFYSVVEHETDEILGTSSCIVGSGSDASTIAYSDNCKNGYPSLAVSAADLFRYSAPGVRSFIGTAGNQADGSAAYFSIDGGATSVAAYNNSPNGADYGDWGSGANLVQNAYDYPGNPGVDVTTDGGAEIAVLDAVGYNLNAVSYNATATPEPATILLFASALAMLTLPGRFAIPHNRTCAKPSSPTEAAPRPYSTPASRA